MQCFKTAAELHYGIAALCAIEPRFSKIIAQHGLPALRSSPVGLESLLMIITEQFLSLQAAATIWARLRNRLNPCISSVVLSCSQRELVKLGLSNTKAKAFHASALFDFNFEGLDEIAVAKKLQSIHGVGPWTADIYLLSVLGATDAWPRGDLALRIAMQDFLSFGTRPELSEMTALSENWRPYRAAAARLLWSHYRGLKGLQQAQ
jgi:DNA-3-methyladenine glycosylase II